MRRYIFATLMAALGSATLVSAQDSTEESAEKNGQKASEYTTLKERASYTIGRNLAAQIKFEDRYEIDFDIAIQGFTDYLKNNPSAMTEREQQDAMLELHKYVRENQEKIRMQRTAKLKELGEKNLKEGREFLAKNAERDEVITTDSGLQYEILKKGDGGKKPDVDDKVKTHYHGTLLDGTVFDSSVERGEPITFPVDGVIEGWTEALQMMAVGDKYKLYVPSKLAYGERAVGPKIGPNSTLIFEVELLDIEEANEND